MAEPIEPRVLKGFRDTLPATERAREHAVRTLADTISTFGFVPIDTPVLEYAEILLGKGGGETDKQVYRFLDQGERDVAMRYDLTVPFARYMAAHRNELYLPFKRYHIAKAWRGENTQRGRYREFIQCDFDIVGATSVSSDLEILLLIDGCLAALGVNRAQIRFSHRGLFNRLLERAGVLEHSEAVLRTVDKLAKIGVEEVRGQISTTVGATAAEAVMAFIQRGDDNASTIKAMESAAGGRCDESQRLREVIETAAQIDFDTELILDPSITRGLDYYTGIVFETFLTELPAIGSICSGGRYDNLASLYTKEQIPGVGASIGIDRLQAALEEIGAAMPQERGADLLIVRLSDELTSHYHRIARQFREAGLSVDVFPESRKLGQQFAFAEKKAIPIAVICGPEEEAAGTVNVRYLPTRENSDGLTIPAAIEAINRLLG